MVLIVQHIRAVRGQGLMINAGCVGPVVLPFFKMVPTVLNRDVFLTVLGETHVSNLVLKS